MFRDSGRYPKLFPDSDDVLRDAKLLNDYPDLEPYLCQWPRQAKPFQRLQNATPSRNTRRGLTKPMGQPTETPTRSSYDR